MKPITKQEAEYIRKRCKDMAVSIPIGMTCRQKSKGKRKKRYLTETPFTLKLLKEYQNI